MWSASSVVLIQQDGITLHNVLYTFPRLLRGGNRALALAKMALDFGTGWRIMDGVEGNGVDMAAAR